MSLSPELRQRIDSILRENRVVLFMKGNRAQPQCGFSGKAVQILDDLLPEYATVNVFADPEIREGIKLYSNWPTLPQLYVNGEFIGGSDIIREMSQDGELEKVLGIDRASMTPPKIELSASAVQTIREAMAKTPNASLLLHISPSFEHSLGFAPDVSGKIETQSQGISIFLDFISAQRADGLFIDFVDTPQGKSLTVKNPNQPKSGQALNCDALKAKLDAKEDLLIYDVRSPENRAQGYIEGSILVDQDVAESIECLPKTSTLVFYCQDGSRSQAASEHFRALGFTKAFFLDGGLDAWVQHFSSAH